jgi:hypothetical protein
MMSEDTWAATKIFIAIVSYFAIAIWLCAGLAERYAESECQAYGELLGYEVKVISGYRCMINDPDKGWMSYEERVGRGKGV